MTGNRRVGVLIAVIVIGCVAVAALTRPAPTSLMDLDSTAPDGANGAAAVARTRRVDR